MTERINAPDFNLAATLECGQAFRWSRGADGWFTGVMGGAVWRLRQEGDEIEWHARPPHLNPLPRGERKLEAIPSPPGGAGQDEGASFLRHYLALDVSLEQIIASFPPDELLHQAVRQYRGLRVLRQEPWETLASFIASSTKQIVQIRHIVAALARQFGDKDAFPTADVIAHASLRQLLDCKLGFRAKYLLTAAQAIDSGRLRLEALPGMEYGRAVEELTKLDGVGEKIAACTLLFSCGHDEAFPVDVWIERALRRLYFADQPVPGRQLRQFARSHFGPYAGWAQQYLFYNERTRDQ